MEDYVGRKIPHELGPVDNSGIPMFDPAKMNLKGDVCYHPVVIIQYGLAHYDLWISGQEPALDIFKLCSKWLMEHVAEEPNGRFLCWYFQFPLRTPKIEPPWISGFAQGQGVSLLARYYTLTKDARAKQVCAGLLKSFYYSHQHGGVSSFGKPGVVFIQEVGEIFVLNGYLAALNGIREYLQVFDDPRAKELHDNVFQTTQKILPHFDMGWWSRYSLGVRFNIADMHYHRVHANHLIYLGNHYKSDGLLVFGNRWLKQLDNPFTKRLAKIVRFIHVNTSRICTLLNFNRLKYRHFNLGQLI